MSAPAEALSARARRRLGWMRGMLTTLAVIGVLFGTASLLVVTSNAGLAAALLSTLPYLGVSIGALVFLRVLRAVEERVASRLDAAGDLSPVAPDARSAAPAAPSVRLELRPDTERRRSAIAALIAALFWNGIVGAIGASVLSDGAPLAPLAFLGLFALIGVGLFGAALYLCAQLLNPRPVVTLARADLALGDEVSCEWRLVGRRVELTRFRIGLRGTEQASYRRGTDKVTKRQVFHESTVFETDRAGLAQRGSTQLRIPRDSMHSWAASDNSIRWTLVVEGAVPRWPDIDDAFEIQIAPRRRTRE